MHVDVPGEFHERKKLVIFVPQDVFILMKRLFLIAMAALMALAVISCKKEEGGLSARDKALQAEFKEMEALLRAAPEDQVIYVSAFGDNYSQSFSRDDNRFSIKFFFAENKVEEMGNKRVSGRFTIPCGDVAPEDRKLEYYYYKWSAEDNPDDIIFEVECEGSKISMKRAILEHDVTSQETGHWYDILAEDASGNYYRIHWSGYPKGNFPAEVKELTGNYVFQQTSTRMSAAYRRLPLKTLDALQIILETGEGDPVTSLDFFMMASPANSALDAIDNSIDRSWFYGLGMDYNSVTNHRILAYHTAWVKGLTDDMEGAGVLRSVNRWGETVLVGYVLPSTENKLQIGFPTDKSWIDIHGQLDVYKDKNCYINPPEYSKYVLTISSPKMYTSDIKDE